jgi:hypothetical protein
MRALFRLGVPLLFVALSGYAVEERGSRGELAAAVDRLAATYGKRFPDAARLRERIAALPADDAASLAALRREALTAHPVLREHPLLFVVRNQFARDHHNTETFFQPGEINTGSYKAPGLLKSIAFGRGGAVTTLYDGGPEAVARDPEVSYDGTKVLFAVRENRADTYHLAEVPASGGEVRRLTRAKGVSDIDPVYLPDGRIVFSSTREPKYCMCNRHIMGNLFRMTADGANIHQIGRSTLFEGHPTVMPDGRLLYDRWEYVDRNFGDAQYLWTSNPDGTAHAVYWGSQLSSPGGVIDARMLPGGDLCLAIFAACHDRPWGALALIDRRHGVDAREAILQTWPPEATNLYRRGGFDSSAGLRLKYEDPYALDDAFFVVSRQMESKSEAMGLFLVDRFGNEVLLHHEAPGCFDPMPLAPRAKPPVIADRRAYDDSPGRFYVQNVYEGTQMTGVERGSVKWLRVIESPEKRYFSSAAWGGQGAQAPGMNWHNFENKRILGTVPVEADGSAYFEAPAGTFLFFQLLDANGQMVQSMRSGTIVQPGEVQGCVGCHEDRTRGLAAPKQNTLAMRRAASKLDGWHGEPQLFSFLRDVQPVFDRHCVSCHDHAKPDGAKPTLAADRDVFFNASYTALWAGKFVTCAGAGPAEVLPAKSWGSHASKLTATLRTNHYGVALSAEEIGRVITWMDLNAPYYPSYSTPYPAHLAGRSPLDGKQIARLAELTGIDLRKKDGFSTLDRAWVSFDRPETSPILAKLATDSPERAEALALIRAGADRLQQTPRGDLGEPPLLGADATRDERYVRRAAIEEENLLAIREGRARPDDAE